MKYAVVIAFECDNADLALVVIACECDNADLALVVRDWVEDCFQTHPPVPLNRAALHQDMRPSLYPFPPFQLIAAPVTESTCLNCGRPHSDPEGCE